VEGPAVSPAAIRLFSPSKNLSWTRAALEEFKREKRELLKLLMGKKISDATYQEAEK
jgi:hypothetical protein